MFDDKLIARAKAIFNTVYVEPDRVRIYPTDWFFEYDRVFYNNDELKAYVEDEEEAIEFENYMLEGALLD